jgi:hypothetical protein
MKDNKQYIRATDLETIKSILEKADIDFEEWSEGDSITYVLTPASVLFSFNAEEELLEVVNE